jgi:hypothetical protein
MYDPLSILWTVAISNKVHKFGAIVSYEKELDKRQKLFICIGNYRAVLRVY